MQEHRRSILPIKPTRRPDRTGHVGMGMPVLEFGLLDASIGINLVSDCHGLDDFIHDVAGFFADHGCLVMASDYYWRIEPGQVFYDATPGGNWDAKIRLDQFFGNEKQAVNDLQWVNDRLRRKCDYVVLLGIGLGGRLAFHNQVKFGADAGAGFYLPHLETALTDLDKLETPFHFYSAANDDRYTHCQLENIRQAVSECSLAELHVVDGGYDFLRPRAHGYTQEGAQMCLNSCLQLFRDLPDG